MINHEQQPYLSMRDSISRFFSSSLKNLGRDTEEFWALKDVSFDVMPGDTIGFIGKNGAGKSTLLKILSKITPPTSGKIIGRGRIASLLEVGTGFHSELSGRENIFMNGSILGMRKNEIVKNFDAIVDFSGVEKFLDTPLKHYSSGMQLRLAFAVAAFLENEILIIDEVLAVGDAEFQKKCMGKMGEVSKSGRTILFVSHNLNAIQNLCSKSIRLNKGKIVGFGSSESLINSYISDSLNTNEKISFNNSAIKNFTLKCDGIPSKSVYMGCEMTIEIVIEHIEIIKYPVIGIVIKDVYENNIWGINNKHYLKSKPDSFKSGKVEIQIPYLPLMSGTFFIDIYLGDNQEDFEVINNAFVLNVEPRDFAKTGYLPNEKYNKIIIKDVLWHFEKMF